jgi:hypothetical protein
MEIINHYCVGDAAVASMLTVYIEEAHASDHWHLPEAPDVLTGDAIIPVHQQIEDRIAAAMKFVDKKKFTGELVCDSMDGEMMDRYNAWPERLYIIVDGVVVFKGGPGPFDYHLYDVQNWLAERYGTRGRSVNKNE